MTVRTRKTASARGCECERRMWASECLSDWVMRSWVHECELHQKHGEKDDDIEFVREEVGESFFGWWFCFRFRFSFTVCLDVGPVVCICRKRREAWARFRFCFRSSFISGFRHSLALLFGEARQEDDEEERRVDEDVETRPDLSVCCFWCVNCDFVALWMCVCVLVGSLLVCWLVFEFCQFVHVSGKRKKAYFKKQIKLYLGRQNLGHTHEEFCAVILSEQSLRCQGWGRRDFIAGLAWAFWLAGCVVSSIEFVLPWSGAFLGSVSFTSNCAGRRNWTSELLGSQMRFWKMFTFQFVE